jgi:6-phosphofructokinase 1
MKHGVRGMVKGEFHDLTDMHQDRLDRLAVTPSAGLGSTRDKPDAAYCERVLEGCKKHNAHYFFYIGGNDSSDTCRLVRERAVANGYDLRCFHVPKTVDNDLMENDHTPGFPSAARFVAMACMADFMDNISLPGIKINVVMGRHAGFLTAAAALMRRREDDGPHLIYIPEVPLELDRMAAEVEAVYRKHKRCHIAVSEGVQDKNGTALLALLTPAEERDAHGNIRLSGTGALGDSLANMLQKKLTPAGGKAPRTRADTLGYAQRYWPEPSPVDASETRLVGRFAARTALSGVPSGSIAIERTGGPGSAHPEQPYGVQFKRVELRDVAAKTRHLPTEWIAGTSNVAPEFVEWLKPLVGPLPAYDRF